MRLLIIGGVAAGMSAAARARRCDRSLEIAVLEKGDSVAWGACGLPYFLEGRVRRLDELVIYTAERFSRERNIEVRTRAEVAAISHPRRQVMLAGGERLPYDKLIIATGARAGRMEGAFPLASMEDALRLKEQLECQKPKRAAVVGAGYLGLELAEVLRTYGCQVTLFEAEPYVLGRPDPDLTELVRRHLERCGVELRLGTPVKTPGDLGDDLVVLAAGFRPNVELAAEAGVDLGRTGAIRVSERMETNLNGVFAAGDCAETTHLVTGRPVYFPLGTTANKMGRIAGANAAGRRERFPGIAGTSIVRVCGLCVAFTGLSEAQARQEGFDPVAARIDARERPRYFLGAGTRVELVADRRTRRIVGGSVIGESGAAGRINVIAAALTGRMRVEDFEQLDLAYAPPFAPVWDPLLIAAQQLSKLLD